MDNKVERAIYKTIIYADIFDFPLTKDELWRFLVTDQNQKIKLMLFEPMLKNLSSKISFKNGFYFLKNREELIKLRLQRKKESKIKLKIAKNIINSLSFIPTILLVGISGNLSIMNADKNDDIDLFVITRKNTLWLTRLMIILLLGFSGKLRRRGEKDVVNKICLNMIISEDALCLPKKRQDLFTAHEIMQMRPIFERNNAYQKFIVANSWVKNFLPNSLNTKRLRNEDIKRRKKSLNIFLVILDSLTKNLQLWYMKKHITSETITDNFLALHPLDHKTKVLKEYRKRLKTYQINLNTRGH